MSATANRKLIRRMPPDERRPYVMRNYYRKHCRVVIADKYGGEFNVHEGIVLAAAVPLSGTISDQLVLQALTSDGQPSTYVVSISLSTVDSITPIED